jgi:hypothetical protein
MTWLRFFLNRTAVVSGRMPGTPTTRPRLQQASGNAIPNDGIAGEKPVDLAELLGVMGAPFDQGGQDGPQALAERREPVFDALAILGAGLPAHHPMVLERSKLLDQHLLRNAGNALLQLAYALRAIRQHVEDDRLPAS